MLYEMQRIRLSWSTNLQIMISVANSWQTFLASSAEKFGRWGKKSVPMHFPWLKAFFASRSKTKLSLSVSVGIVKHFLDFSKCRERKSRKTNFLEVRPLFNPFCTIAAKIRPQFVLSLCFLFGPFWVKRPNIRPVGNTYNDIMSPWLFTNNLDVYKCTVCLQRVQ